MSEAAGVGPSYYQRWLEGEGIPVIRDFYLRDIRTVPLEPWDRKGGLGVYLNLAGSAEADDAYICEIPPGGSLRPQRHLYEELIFVIRGRGATRISNGESEPQTFEWEEGSLFSPPLNTWHQHFNGSGSQPARFLAVTNAPIVLNLLQNSEFAFGSDFVFSDRYRGEEGYFSGKGRTMGIRSWETNFVKDVRAFELVEWKQRGAGGKSIFFELCENSMTAHISEFPVGTYKKAHRHGPGAHVIILRGKGHTLMWEAGKPMERFDWQEGTLIVPPEGWFHQHFNTGREPARYIAFHRPGSSRKYRMGKRWGTDVDLKEGGDQIEYKDEDPLVLRLFEQELAKEGVPSRMGEVLAGSKLPDHPASRPPDEEAPSFYQRWLQSEGIPVIRDFTIPDVRTVPLSPWKRKGGAGVHLNLVGTGEIDDAYLCEIPPGETLNPQRHLFEEMIFILSGRGVSTVWQEGGPRHEIPWQRGTLFSPPLNSWHQHRNLDPARRARYLAITNAPVFLNLFHNPDFVFQNPRVFSDRFPGTPGYFEGAAEFAGGRLWKTNLVPDVYTFGLVQWERRGARFGSAHFELSDNVMAAHIAELPPGVYAKAHRHVGGAHVLILHGKGYTLMWEEGKAKQRFDWQEGSLLVPPEGWFHQHFNTGPDPVRQLAMRWGGPKGHPGRQWRPDTDIREGGDQISYEDDDPEVREMFQEELARAGVPLAMGSGR